MLKTLSKEHKTNRPYTKILMDSLERIAFIQFSIKNS